MSTLVTTNQFLSDTEGWVATITDPNIDAMWFKPQRHGHVFRDNPPLSDYGGCLRMTTAANTHFTCASSENYWELTTTWETLGIPIGGVVSDVTADYQYRFQCRTRTSEPNEIAFSNTEAASGPFEFRDDLGVLIDTFSVRGFCIARTGIGDWLGYPTGFASDPISVTPPSWTQAAGATVTVPLAQSPSGSTVKFRLRNLTPASVVTTGICMLRVKQDHVVLTITYSTPITRRRSLTVVI